MAASSRTPKAAGATPAMAQWFAAKEAHPDALVFFRMGDFYELFFSDAEAAAAALDIALTQRGEHDGKPIPMCGVPQHAAEAYLARLIRRGFRVAVAEQMEDPKARTGKAPIRRDVVRLVTPGTITEEALLEAGRANLLLGLAQDRDGIGAAWLDVSTGLFETAALAQHDLPGLLGRLEPAEILSPPELPLGDWAERRAPDVAAVAASGGATTAGRNVRRRQRGRVRQLHRCRGDRGAAGGRLRPRDAGRNAAAAGASGAAGKRRPAGNGCGDAGKSGDPSGARRRFAALAVGHSAADADPRGRAATGELAGRAARRTGRDRGTAGRLGVDGRGAPCRRTAARRAAHRAGYRAGAWAAVGGSRRTAGSGGATRRTAGRASDRDGARHDTSPACGRAERAGRGCRRRTKHPLPPRSATRPPPQAGEVYLAERLHLTPRSQPCALDPSLEQTLIAALADPAPHRLDDGNAVRPGFDAELDAERALRDDTRRVLATLQLDYAQRYGVASLKIRHHAQLGYVIEAPAAAVEKLRDVPELTLRQGMANGARFTTPELSDLDRRIAEAGDRAAARERAVFAHLVERTLAHAESLAACADALAFLDATQSAAKLAEAGTWCRPLVTDNDAFLVRAGRHPVVEAALAGRAQFVPNDGDLSPDQRVLLLTGPNMAGKSTFLRQNALIVVLAQAGLPVPAESATIGVVDRLFSRVGAADDLARGRSTFMVEMTETAAILHQAGPRSLVVVDEIGRGTATLDGLAIAWAVLEALHSAIRCRTIFATHFHELAELADRLPRMKPHTMRVKEWKKSVVFLHEVAAGAAGRSWGVHVAELAGVPAPVVRRAASLLASLEKHGGPLGAAGAPLTALPLFAASSAESAPERDPLSEEIAALEPDRMTPREALDALYRLKALQAVPDTAGN